VTSGYSECADQAYNSEGAYKPVVYWHVDFIASLMFLFGKLLREIMKRQMLKSD